MRHLSALLKRKISWATLAGAVLMLTGSASVKAQTAFSDRDWLLDRGSTVFSANNNGAALRQGYNNFDALGNNPGPGARIWIWPFLRDINAIQIDGAPSSTSLSDNPNAADPRQPRSVPQNINSLSVLIGPNWTIPPPADRTGRGFSITGNANQPYTNDYAYTPARTTNFGLNGVQIASLSNLPNVPPAVYAPIHNALVADTTNRALYTSGNLASGRYGIEIHSPGNGTIIPQGGNRVAHANARQVLVRVSWNNTINAGAINQAGVDNPITSRLFLVDLSGSANGWIPIQSGNLGPASFPTNGNPANQIVVSIYSLTPDSSGTDPFHIVPADAVRFVLQRENGNLNLGPINPIGRVLGPAVGTDKLGNPPLTYFYVAREESVPEAEIANPELRSWENPVDATTARTIDPTALATVPVFYCLDNRRGNTIINGREINSFEKVRWRYVGATSNVTGGNISSPGSSTSSASPLLANVRLRNGQTRTILYFVTTNASNEVGRIYAFNPNPDVPNPQVYWTYPSVRPLTAAEANNVANPVPTQLHDPNYKGFTQGTFPVQTFGNDLPAIPGSAVFYYDGEIIAEPTNPNQRLLKNDVNMLPFGGMQSAPTIADDPANAGGAQLLIVGNMNGRVYAFDAGGRGDFEPNYNPATPLNTPGTTQRLWTWPRTRADAYHATVNPNVVVNNPFLLDETAKVNFPSSPALDPQAGINAPFLIGSADGHMYALSAGRDGIPAVVNGTPTWNERRAWMYPEANSSLGRAPSTPAIFQNDAGARAAFFTCGGRVYALNLVVPNSPTSDPDIAPLNWVYPSTLLPPNETVGDPNSVAITPEFAGNAPVVLRGAVAYRQNIANARDLCYVATGAGRMLALEAFTGTGLPNLVSQGEGADVGSVVSSPIVSLISSNLNQDAFGELYTVTSRPALIYSDTNGSIHAVGTEPLPDFQNNDRLLPYWKWEDADTARTAPPILASGVIVQGTQGGLVYAYSIGDGANGAGDTLGSGPVPGRNPRGAGLVSIDMRVFDIYSQTDWDRMMLPLPGGLTPGKDQTGNPFPGKTAVSLTTGNPRNYIIAEWGDYLYVAAWGVYKGQTTNPNAAVHGTAPPQINVTFTLGGSGAPVVNRVTVPATYEPVPPFNPTTPPELWVDDMALNDTEKNGFAIYGQDLNSGFRLYTGRSDRNRPDDKVFTWVAKTRIHINPTIDKSYAPGLGSFSISAEAEIRQNITDGTTTRPEIRSSNRYRLGQYDWAGMSITPNAPASSTRNGTPPREIFIANPIGVTVRGLLNGNNSGDTIPNTIGMGYLGGAAGNYALITGKGELLSNGNKRFDPATLSNQGSKAVYAPVGMIENGTTQTYAGLNGNQNDSKDVPAFFVVDRSNLLATTGSSLRIQAATRPLVWYGGPSAVMNPLPWEQLPNDNLGTSDYPNIAPENIRVMSDTGQSATESLIALKPPTYTTSVFADRIANPTRFDLQISVPKYQPANVNWGRASVSGRFLSGSRNFGQSYKDVSGTDRGTGIGGDNIFGPLDVLSGLPVTNNRTYPAGGYVSEVVIVAVPSGQTVRRFNPMTAFTDFRTAGNPGLASFDTPYRGFEMGITVPPSIKMRVAEKVLDIGKVPHGTGFSDQITTGNFRAPFAPSRSLIWQNDPNGSPWESFFLPFTVYNESNINLFDVRVEKLRGASDSQVGLASLSNFPPPGFAYATRLFSNQVNNITGLPLISLPFNYGMGGVGNIGITSSLDHRKWNYPNTATAELNLWPVFNPFVLTNQIQFLGLDRVASDTLAETYVPWGANLQGNPTLHKARVGDNQPTFLTVPDVPYGITTVTLPNQGTRNVADLKPQIGIAIPLGAASGTYSAPINVFQDGIPYQWHRWQELSAGATRNVIGREHDGIFNIARAPIEPFAFETFQLKATVTEARLTQGITRGTLSQIDLMNDLHLYPSTNPLFVGTDANLLPTAIFVPGSPQTQGIYTYWTSNRTGNNNAVSVNRPWNIMMSGLPSPGGSLLQAARPIAVPSDFQFAQPGLNGILSAKWWTNPRLVVGNSTAADLNRLFPQLPTATVPGLPGIPTATTERHASPQAVIVYNTSNALDADGFLFWQGEVDKVLGTGQQARQQTDSRTFYTRLLAGQPQPNGIKSFFNDPALTKLSPKPLYLKVGGQQFLYVFWHAGNGGQTALYYNVSATPDNAASWTADRRLPTPNALTWQSDAQPMYRQVRDASGNVRDAIDFVFTGVLKSRQQSELFLIRYYIETNGTLTGAVLLPRVEQQSLMRVGATNTYIGRDAGWYLPADESVAEIANNIQISVLRRENNGGKRLIPLNKRPDPEMSFQTGQFDKASGLLFFNSALGGQVVVDVRAGTVTFPNIAPRSQGEGADEVLVSYTPQVMRLSVARDDTNVDRTQLPPAWQNDPTFKSIPPIPPAGNYANPVAILDRGLNGVNPRVLLSAPAVMRPANASSSLDRMWVIYRKTDGRGSGLYYKAMRLMIKLPRPFRLTPPNGQGQQQISGVSVKDDANIDVPCEVDWVRGRIYFTSIYEGIRVRVNYTMQNNEPSGELTYRVAWGDEISSAAQRGDYTTPEVLVPTDTSVNEGQVAAFKDPFSDRLWMFWTSTRNSTTDLYYQTLLPQFYPVTNNQQ